MSQEEQAQVSDDNAFLAGFNEVRPSDDFQLPEVEQEEVAEEKEPEAEAKAEEPEQKEEATEQEAPRIAGFTEVEIRRLLDRAAKVDELEQQVRKANGKIGELNGKLNEFSTKRPEVPAVSPAIDNPELEQWAKDYPELVALAEARANAIADAKLNERLGNIQAPDVSAIKAEIQRETQLELMDTLHEGWRETVSTQEFNTWLASQDDNTQQLFATTERANDLSRVLKGFESWKKNTVDRSAKSKQRLEAALTPSGAPSKPVHAPTEEDAFLAGFRNIRPN